MISSLITGHAFLFGLLLFLFLFSQSWEAYSVVKKFLWIFPNQESRLLTLGFSQREREILFSPHLIKPHNILSNDTVVMQIKSGSYITVQNSLVAGCLDHPFPIRIFLYRAITKIATKVPLIPKQKRQELLPFKLSSLIS